MIQHGVSAAAAGRQSGCEPADLHESVRRRRQPSPGSEARRV